MMREYGGTMGLFGLPDDMTPRRPRPRPMGKEEGLALVRAHLRVLYQRRERELGKEEAFVTADDARDYVEGHTRLTPGNWMGNIFRDGSWTLLEGKVRSRVPSNRGRSISRWRLR